MHTPCQGGDMAEGSGFRIQATHLLACTYSYIYSPELPPSAALPLYFRCKIVALSQPSPCQTVAFPQYIARQSLLIGALTTRRGTAESFDDARAPDQREREASRRRFRSRAGCGVTAGSASPSALILRKSVVLWTPSSRAAAARLPPWRSSAARMACASMALRTSRRPHPSCGRAPEQTPAIGRASCRERVCYVV